MSSVSRLSLPPEFTELVTERLLVQPEPDYFWANLAYASNVAMELRNGDTPILPFGTNLNDTSPKVSQELQRSPQMNARWPLASAIFTDLYKDADANQTVRMNRIVFTDSTYTVASRLVTRQTISTTGLSISEDQVELTIQRYAGPYGSSAVQPYQIQSFDIARKPLHSLVSMTGLHLRRDRKKFVDTVVADSFCTAAPSSAYVYPGDFNNSITADSSAFSAQGDRPLDLETMIRAEEVLKNNKVPTFENGYYAAVISPRQERQLKTASDFMRQVQFLPDRNIITSRYIGTVGTTDIFVSQTNPTTTTGSITVQQGVAFGPGVLGIAVAKGCEAITDPATNFDQYINIIWRADEGYRVLENRNCVSIRSN